MIVMINGSFGVGKTTVAKLLCHALPGSVIYDPEWVGYVLRRLPKWITFNGSGTDDYQDIDLWRRSVVAGTRLFHLCATGPVIIPMTFSHQPYFDEIVTGIRRIDPELRVFCLRAPLATIQQRVVKRGDQIDGPAGAWIARRIRECVDAHRNVHFGEPVHTEERSAHEVAQQIIQRLNHPGITIV